MRKIIVLAFMLLSTAGLAGTAHAYQLSSGDQNSLSKDTNVTGSYYAVGNSIDIRGNVSGDVFCAGQNVVIDGSVGGDVLCAAQNITINGDVTGNVRVAAQSVTINGKVGRNATVFAQTLTTSKDSFIAGELMAQSETINLAGTVTAETYGSAQALTINGHVNGRVRYEAETVTIGSGAVLASGLDYTSTKGATVNSGAQITGKTTHNTPVAPKEKSADKAQLALSGLLLGVLSASVTGALLIWFLPRFVVRATNSAARPGYTLFMGFAALILTPIAALVITFTFIGIPVALIALTLWGIALYLSRIITALAIGNLLLDRLSKNSARGPRPYIAGFLGILVSWIIFAIPFLGGFATFLAVLFGMGVITLAVRDRIDHDDVATVKAPAKA